MAIATKMLEYQAVSISGKVTKTTVSCKTELLQRILKAASYSRPAQVEFKTSLLMYFLTFTLCFDAMGFSNLFLEIKEAAPLYNFDDTATSGD